MSTFGGLSVAGKGGVVLRHHRERTIIPLIFPAWFLLQASGLSVSLRRAGCSDTRKATGKSSQENLFSPRLRCN